MALLYICIVDYLRRSPLSFKAFPLLHLVSFQGLHEDRHQPEEYHSAAMQHLEMFLASMSEPDQAGFGGGLEELQAVLLLAGFALLRPVGT